jgi:hypothetical protein
MRTEPDPVRIHQRAAAFDFALNLMPAEVAVDRDGVIHIHLARAGMRVQIEGGVRWQAHVHATGTSMGFERPRRGLLQAQGAAARVRANRAANGGPFY